MELATKAAPLAGGKIHSGQSSAFGSKPAAFTAVNQRSLNSTECDGVRRSHGDVQLVHFAPLNPHAVSTAMQCFSSYHYPTKLRCAKRTTNNRPANRSPRAPPKLWIYAAPPEGLVLRSTSMLQPYY